MYQRNCTPTGPERQPSNHCECCQAVLDAKEGKLYQLMLDNRYMCVVMKPVRTGFYGRYAFSEKEASLLIFACISLNNNFILNSEGTYLTGQELR